MAKKTKRVPSHPRHSCRHLTPLNCSITILAATPEAYWASPFPLAKSKRGRNIGAEGSPLLAVEASQYDGAVEAALLVPGLISRSVC